MAYTHAICMIGYKLIVTIDANMQICTEKSIENSILYCLSRLYAYATCANCRKIFHDILVISGELTIVQLLAFNAIGLITFFGVL